MTSKLFEKLRGENRAALVLFVSCGDPTMDFSERLIEKICASGADIVELGVPFSDPMADGKSIQAASRRALDGGATIGKVLDMAKRLRQKGVKNPFVMFSYFNPVFKYGVEKVADKCADAGIDSLLVVDAPLEESAEITSVATPRGIEFIPLAAPTSPLERVEKISAAGSGFLYYVTVAGVTGIRGALPEGFAKRLADVRKASKLPVAAGFGISTPEMAHAAAKSADAVVVGSKFVDLAYKTHAEQGEEAALKAAAGFVSSLAAQMKR